MTATGSKGDILRGSDDFRSSPHFGWYALTQANYVEHYGLLREKSPNGRYQSVEPRHSWNTNHIVSNLMTFHLQRHSDHPRQPDAALPVAARL